MEISGAVLRRAPFSSGAGFRQDAGESFCPSVARAGRRARIPARHRGFWGGGFSDEGNLQYYLPPVMCGGRKKEEKKRAKLVKVLSKDLSAFYSMGFGVEAGDGVAGEVKGKMMTEAAELLLSQLKQLRAEEKELKRKRKQEKAVMKAARVKDRAADDDTSSSSSSGSSDSEGETVIRMSNLRTADVAEPKPDARAPPTQAEERVGEIDIASKPRQACCSSSCSAAAGSCKSCAVVAAKPMEKIEVCMGGKCKRSGAPELLEEFERMVGVEGAVVGCKCMGKCRDGPNVRVSNHCNEEGSVKASRNPLCLGVGLEDVGAIVANFFWDKEELGLLPA